MNLGMSDLTANSSHSPRRLHRALLALAFFILIWGAKLLVIDRFGSDLPFWDQWEKEGMHLYPAWFENHELWRPLFTPHNEHRIAPTLATNLALVVAGGQWDARVQCIVSAALHAALLTGLFLWALRRVPLPWALAAGAILAGLGAAPIVWENILSGFQSQFYFLAGFSLLAIGGLVTQPAFSPRWWASLVAGALALLSMGSGLLWTAPVLLVTGVRILFFPTVRRDALVTFAAAVLLLAAGAALHTSVAAHSPLRADSVGTFLLYAARGLAWPLYHHTWLAPILWLPWLALAGFRVAELRRPRLPTTTAHSADDFLLAAGLWVLLQVAAVSYSRGAGGEFPANRYGDLCSLGLAFSALSFTRLRRRLPEPAPLGALWGIVAAVSLAVASHTTWTIFLPHKKSEQLAYEQNVHAFVLTGDLPAFTQQKDHLPFPNPDWLADILRRPSTRALLPASVRPPLTIPGLANTSATPTPAPPLNHRATRTLTAPGEWRSAELPPRQGWWKIETAGHLGAPGTVLQLVATRDNRVLATLAPAKPPGAAWRAVYVRAPAEPARFVARTDSADRWFSFSEPVEMSALSYRARAFAKQGWLLLALGAIGTLALAAALLRPRLSISPSLHPSVSPSPPHLPSASRLSLPLFLAAALVSVVISIPFLPAAKTRGDLFLLEARVSSTAAGAFQIYYDDGSGLSEELSGRATISGDGAPATFQFPLPAGTYKSLRLDPLDGTGSVTLSHLRIVSRTGRNIADLPLAAFQSAYQIASTRLADGALHIATTPDANDPQLTLAFTPPLVLAPSWRDYLPRAWRVVLPVFAALATLLFLVDRAPRTRAALTRRIQDLATRPARAVALVAALAVVASAYPVVFLGQSYVSPNHGTILLYDTFPTLPGYRAAETVDVKLSDVGAVMWQHVPFSMLQRRALAQGELPLWNRYSAAGVPLLAQGQSMFGDPLHLLVIAANGAAWAWDAKYLLAKWLFATALGLTVLALRAPRPKDQKTNGPKDPKTAPSESPLVPSGPLVSALLVSAAVPFIGFFLYRLNHPAFFSLCYAPWSLYCFVRISQANTVRSLALWCAALLGANLALMNSGTVKEAYMLLVGMNLSGACVLLTSATPWRQRLLRLAAVAWTGLLFALLTAPIWVTFLQTLKNAYTGYNAVSAYQIQPTLLLGAFDEIFYRPLLTNDWVFSPSLNFLLLLGLLYFLATLRAHFAHRAAMALAVSSLVPLSLAFGFISPQWIVKIPFLANIAHVDNTFSCVLIVLWSVLAGLGFATAAQRLGTAEGRRDLIVAGLLLGALVFGWTAFGHAAHRPIYGPIVTVNQPGQILPVSPFIWHYLIALLLASVALVLLVHRACAQRRCPPATAFLIALCLATLLWRHGLHASTIGYEAFTARPTTRVDFHARSPAIEFTRAAHAREPGRGFGFNGNFFPGWTGVYGLETIHGPDALVNPFLRELVTVSGLERIWDWRLYLEAPGIGKARPFFDALNVRFYFDSLSKHPALAQHLRLAHSADLDVYESPTAWPRAFFTDRVAAYDQPAELIAKINAANGRPFAAAQRTDLTANPRLAALATDAPAPTVTAATAYQLSEHTTTFRIRATAPGAVVLTETFWKDSFRAELNGRRVPIVRLNHAFKGVLVDAPGDYTVTFRYWPRNFLRYLLLSGLGAALLIASLVLALRPARRA